MRKRSAYRPKGVRLDAMTYVMQGLTPVREVNGAALTLKIKNHDSLAAVARGTARIDDVDLLMGALNVTEAIAMQRIGEQYEAEIRAGQEALATMAARGLANGHRFVCTGQELQAINLAMEVHDAQLDAVTVGQLEQALNKVDRIVRSGGATKI